MYASAQALDFLATTENARFLSENLIIAIQCFRMTTSHNPLFNDY